jgi:hypothetical protein
MYSSLVVGVDITDINDMINIMQKQTKFCIELDEYSENSSYYLDTLTEAFETYHYQFNIQNIFNQYMQNYQLDILNNLNFCSDIITNIQKFYNLTDYPTVVTSPNYTYYNFFPNSVENEKSRIESIFIGIKVGFDFRSPSPIYNSASYHLMTNEIDYYSKTVKLLLNSLNINYTKYLDKILIKTVVW